MAEEEEMGDIDVASEYSHADEAVLSLWHEFLNWSIFWVLETPSRAAYTLSLQCWKHSLLLLFF